MTQRGTARLLGEAIQADGGDFDAGDSSLGVNWNGLSGMGEALGIMRDTPQSDSDKEDMDREARDSLAWRLLERLR